MRVARKILAVLICGLHECIPMASRPVPRDILVVELYRVAADGDSSQRDSSTLPSSQRDSATRKTAAEMFDDLTSMLVAADKVSPEVDLDLVVLPMIFPRTDSVGACQSANTAERWICRWEYG